ncbi:PHP domain-containing protein [Inconstantimicrobium mannanitabidum]|uniref:Uncharacterized protein n=1 Tax=Inconstantimicrobium mannanitabidum TaxID=1604901 RepID=A0ACB5RDH4_9CLOT|nr:PHP domain-containing protein [Clostridium sp. TW13]GKX67320.1 hypothetical protein rsdtw13_25780 [Clostridium sp. TW13]
MKIDLHLHTSERSKCSIATEEQQIKAAISYGLDAIVISDHNKLVPVQHIEELNEKYKPFKIFGGIEITIHGNNNMNEDILVIGLHDEILQEKTWTYEEVYNFVKSRGGYIALNHPFRYSEEVNIDIERCIPDAIEVHSTNISRLDEQLITDLAKRLGSKLICNSDAHNIIHTGIYYNDIGGNPKNDKELVEKLLAGEYKLCKDDKRVDEHNKQVKEREDFIKELIKQGKTAEDYCKITGSWAGPFEKVARGKSYEI